MPIGAVLALRTVLALGPLLDPLLAVALLTLLAVLEALAALLPVGPVLALLILPRLVLAVEAGRAVVAAPVVGLRLLAGSP